MNPTLQSHLDRRLSGISILGKLSNLMDLLDQGANPCAHQGDSLKNAVKVGHLECVQALITAGGDRWGRSMLNDALVYAVINGQIVMAELLIEHGADPQHHQNQAIREAAGNGNLPMVQFLLLKGADLQEVNNSALKLSIEKGHLETAQYLIEQGASLEVGLKTSEYGRLNHPSIYEWMKNVQQSRNEQVILKQCLSESPHSKIARRM